ncbi:MAG: hypothetical protein ACPGED_04970, partial [Flavobacteriales bacterium]
MQKCSLLAVALFVWLSNYSQSPSEDLARLEAKYQNEVFVNTSHVQRATIEIKKGALVVNEFHQTEAFYLSDDASRFSKESVPYGYFTEIKDLEA